MEELLYAAFSCLFSYLCFFLYTTVIHGSHNVTLDSNVAYDTKGHCFLLEDSGEMDNVLTGNLAAVTRKVETKIRPEESDEVPSSFWLTNPLNTFVGNVAAGSEHSGFWFEMKSSVREPTKSMLSLELSKMNPSRLQLTRFEDNVAHSCIEHGIKTYPGVGLEPDGDPAVFLNSKSYRNRGDGVFIHKTPVTSISQEESSPTTGLPSTLIGALHVPSVMQRSLDTAPNTKHLLDLPPFINFVPRNGRCEVLNCTHFGKEEISTLVQRYQTRRSRTLRTRAVRYLSFLCPNHVAVSRLLTSHSPTYCSPISAS